MLMSSRFRKRDDDLQRDGDGDGVDQGTEITRLTGCIHVYEPMCVCVCVCVNALCFMIYDTDLA